MRDFVALLRGNKNYRWLWSGQVVSEVGDHFNTIAVFSLILDHTQSGLAVSGVMLARAVPMLLAGPLAGVCLDRFDRRRLMLASDLVRAVVAVLFLLAVPAGRHGLLYPLSAMLMFASPFFTAGRASILPAVTRKEELHAANSLTQTTQWSTTAIGSFLGGASAAHFGYEAAFLLNALSFVFSAVCVYFVKTPEREVAKPARGARPLNESVVMKPWHDYREGLRYMKSVPIVLAVALVGVGWATGGGAAQILFSLYGEKVFRRGPEGIGQLWGAAGVGLVFGGIFAHWLTPRLSFAAYKKTVALAYIVHGATYVTFALIPSYAGALIFIAASRAAVAVSSVANFSMLLHHVADDFRGRVFATMETLVWATMMLSMTGAGLASDYVEIRTIGAAAGMLSMSTALWWTWADIRGRLPEPRAPQHAVPSEDVEVHGDPRWNS